MKPVCIAVLFASLCLHEADSCVFGAPVRWEGNGNSYEVVPGNYDWLQAESLARQMGGHLATITTQAENDFVYGLTQGHWTPLFGTNTWWNYGPWIGAHRPFGPGTSGWNWVTPRNEEPFGSNPQFWAAGEPNNENGIETNAHYFTSRAASGAGSPITAPTWNDLNFRADRTGASGLPFVVEYESCENLLRNSVRIEAVDSVIRAHFVPNLGYTLQQAASTCNVQSFNWLNSVVLPSRHRTWIIGRSNWAQDPFIWQQPFVDSSGELLVYDATKEEVHGALVDPILFGTDRVYITTYEKPNGWAATRTNQTGSDEFEYYFNEYDTGIGDIPIVTDYQLTDRTLFFEDKPRSPLGYFQNGEFKAFTTRLAGVGFDGLPITWKGLGTTFTWKSDLVYGTDPYFEWGTVINGEIVYTDFMITTGDNIPAPLSGRIFDVRIDNIVPEPSAVALLVSGSLLMIRRWRQGLACQGRRTSTDANTWA